MQYWLNVDQPNRTQMLHLDDGCGDVRRRGAGGVKPVGSLNRIGGWLTFDAVEAAVADSETRLDERYKHLGFCTNCQINSAPFKRIAIEHDAAIESKVGTEAPLSLLTREHILEALRLLKAGRPTAFAESTKYDLLFEGARYPPKRVAGLALEQLTHRPFTPQTFKGGQESTCFRVLERAGFTIAPKRSPGVASLTDTLGEILDLQRKYSKDNTVAMQRRGILVRVTLRQLIENHLEEIEPIFSSAGYAAKVEGKDGVGRKVESAWVRLFDDLMSPSATQGWYVVLHFSRLGQYFYLTLGCGATTFKDGSLHPIATAVLESRIAWARALPTTAGFDARRFSDKVELHGNDLSRQFERAIAYARRYEIADFDEPDFWSDVRALSKRLTTIYDFQRQGSDPAAISQEVEFLQSAIAETISPTKTAQKGQGRGLSGPERFAVERRAMDVTYEGLIDAGFNRIVDTSDKESYDFKGEKDGKEWLIEVKGTTGQSADLFLLTAAELRLHRARKGDTILAMVSNIQLVRTGGIKAIDGVLLIEMPWDPDAWTFEPTAFRATRGENPATS